MASTSAGSTTFDPDDLVRHGRFVKRLAVQLVGDDEAADELAARTMATAWQRRPSSGRTLREWLRTVVRRTLRTQRRDDERRTRRELDATRDAARATAPATIDLVARIELEQKIAAAFAQLEEPYKSTLFLRHFDDLLPVDIAERTGVPIDTVKTRLKRGHDRLRALLDARPGSPRSREMAIAFVLQGGPIVATKSKLVPAVVAALLVVSGSVAIVEVARRGENAANSPAAIPAATADRDSFENPANPEVGLDRTPSAQRTPDAAAVLPFASGIVVDAAEHPLSGVDVLAGRLRRDKFFGTNDQEPLRLDRLERDRLATTGADGRFVVLDPGIDLIGLHFVLRGFAAEEWSELSAQREQNQERRVVLRPGSAVRGIVLDTDHRAIVSARVELLPDPIDLTGPNGSTGPPTRTAANLPDTPEYRVLGCQLQATDANGRFEFTSPHAPRSRLGVMAAGYASTQRRSEDVTDPCEITMQRSGLILDVRDADTSEPVKSSMVVTDSKSGAVLQQVVPWLPRDVDHSVTSPPGRLVLLLGYGQPHRGGALWLQDAPDGREVELHVVASGYVGDVIDVELSSKKEPPHLEIELTPLDDVARDVAISGRCTGAPRATHATIAAFALIPGWSENYLEVNEPLLAVECDEHGEFRLRDLPEGRYRLVARAKGCAPTRFDVDAPASDVVLALEPSATIEARVHDHTGAPRKGVVVHAQPREGHHAWAATTDAGGIARLEGLPAGMWRIGAFEGLLYDYDDRVTFPLDVSCFLDDPIVTTQEGESTRVELALAERVEVRFHFERDDGSPVTQVALDLATMDGPARACFREMDRLRPLHLELDTHCDASAELFPGHYEFTASEANLQRRVEFDVPRTPLAPIVIRLPSQGPTGTLTVRYVERDSRKPIVGRKVFVAAGSRGANAIQLGTQVTDATGTVRYEAVPAGPVQVNFYGSYVGNLGSGLIPESDSPYGVAVRHCTVVAGEENAVEVAVPVVKPQDPAIPTVELQARVTEAATGKPLERATVSIEIELDGTTFDLGYVSTDADGRASAKLFVADRYQVTVSAQWAESGTFQTSHLDLSPKDGVLEVEVVLQPGPGPKVKRKR